MHQQKQLWLLAGGNGAGKSTFYRVFLEPKGLPFVNADNLAKQLAPSNAEAFSYQAAKMAEKLRLNLLKSGVSFCFETVFSHPSKIDFLAKAKSCGYQIVLIYIHLESAELNQARVAQRVSEGGHDVPADKIVSRIPRTLKHIAQALPLADYVQFYDNSSLESPFALVASSRAGIVEQYREQQPPWLQDLLSAAL